MTATPVDKTYIMLMVADMTRAMRFYTEAFDVKVVINSPYWSEFMRCRYEHRAASRRQRHRNPHRPRLRGAEP